MSSALPEIFLNGQLAKRRLEEVFDMTDSGRQARPITRSVQVTTDENEVCKRQRLARDLTRSRDIVADSTRKETRLRRSNRTNRDMTTSCFTLTLLLIATIAAAYTDRPAFWLLMGPVPLAAGFGMAACFQQRLGRRSLSRQVGRGCQS